MQRKSSCLGCNLIRFIELISGYSKVDKIKINAEYYNDVQTISRLVIERYKCVTNLRNQYAEAANMLKAVKHRNELAFSGENETITYLRRAELWALNAAIDDLATEPHPDMPMDKLNVLSEYLKQFSL